jgi:hypothetical protein
MFSNCLQCVNSTYCSVCLNSSFYPIAIPDSQFCIGCSLALPDCLTCSSATACTLCAASTHYLYTDGQCHLCEEQVANCLTCTWDVGVTLFLCDTCQSGYIVDLTNQCLSCSSIISDCQLCSSALLCDACFGLPAVAFSASANSCLGCGILYGASCLECDDSQCTLCAAGLTVSPAGTSCQCIVGYYMNGRCSSIFGCIQFYEQNGVQTCLLCNATLFHALPVDNVC